MGTPSTLCFLHPDQWIRPVPLSSDPAYTQTRRKSLVTGPWHRLHQELHAQWFHSLSGSEIRLNMNGFLVLVFFLISTTYCGIVLETQWSERMVATYCMKVLIAKQFIVRSAIKVSSIVHQETDVQPTWNESRSDGRFFPRPWTASQINSSLLGTCGALSYLSLQKDPLQRMEIYQIKRPPESRLDVFMAACGLAWQTMHLVAIVLSQYCSSVLSMPP